MYKHGYLLIYFSTDSVMADCDDFIDNPVACTICTEVALDGREGNQAIVCAACGSTICENCNDPNSDSDKDSGLGEE